MDDFRRRDGGGVMDRCSDARPFSVGVEEDVSASALAVGIWHSEDSLGFFAGPSISSKNEW